MGVSAYRGRPYAGEADQMSVDYRWQYNVLVTFSALYVYENLGPNEKRRKESEKESL